VRSVRRYDAARRGSSFVTVVKKDQKGRLYRSLLKEVNVNQTLGLPEQEFLALGTFSKNNPSHN
jgi:branched-chain amino acid transport system substrate-binding protein